MRSIDIERGDRTPDAIAAAIADELLHGGSCPEVGVAADGTRVTLSTVPVDVEPGTLPLGPSDVVIVSGGGRGVTAATMIELARASSATFVLLGRSQLDDEPEQYRSAVGDAALKRIVLDGAMADGRTMTPAELDDVVGNVLANREIRATIASIGIAGGRPTTAPSTSPISMPSSGRWQRSARTSVRSPPSSTAPACWPTS